MKAMTTLMILLLAFNSIKAHNPSQPVNAILGDESFISRYGSLPTAATNEALRIKTHLAYVEMKLRQADARQLNTRQKINRSLVIGLLHQYWNLGAFPANYDYPGERRPCFIDRNGNICAVGYLIAKTSGRQLAIEINKAHQYEYLLDMHDPKVESWAKEYGLSLEECAMIQPTYGYIPSAQTKEIPVKNGYGISSGLVGGFNLAATMINLSKTNTSKYFQEIGIVSGAAQVIMGLTNTRKDEWTGGINGYATTYSYKAQNNLSYINIAMGTTTMVTSAVNLFLRNKMRDSRSALNVYSYTGMFQEMNVGLSFSRRL